MIHMSTNGPDFDSDLYKCFAGNNWRFYLFTTSYWAYITSYWASYWTNIRGELINQDHTSKMYSIFDVIFQFQAKIFTFLIFSGGIEREQWPEMG